MAVRALDVLRVYWRGVRPRRVILFFMMLAIGGASILELIVPLYYRQFFDVLSQAGIYHSGHGQRLVAIILHVLIFNACMWACYRFATFVNGYFQSKVMADLRTHAFDYLLGHSYGFFANNFGGSLVQRINRHARAFERLSDRVAWNVFPLVVRVAGIAIALWFVNKTIMVIMLGWAFLFLCVNYIFSRWKLPYDIKRANTDSHTTAVLADAITNHTTIQLFTGFNFESRRFSEAAEEQRAITRLSWDLSATLDAAQGLLVVLIEFTVFYYAIKYWELGVITLGTFVLLQTYLIQLIGRLWDFTRVIRDIYESFADSKEMVEIMATTHEIKDARNAAELKVKKGEIKFVDVSFNFHKTRNVISNLNLTIKAGEKVALIGPSGAGKSTLIKLLFRFYDTSAGTILIDGQTIRKVTQESLRAQVSLVPQDPILFHRTLMDNIRYGRKDAADDEVIRAATLAHCDEFIRDMPVGYETFVGERGVKLSGGERQRVAIARAILKNAPILVLDEATSSLDSHSEALIQDALATLMKGKTVVVVAHRLSTIRSMDRIIVVEGGKIVEQGDHELLLKNPDSLYTKLWTLQAGGFLREGDGESPDTDSDDNNQAELE